MIITKCLLVDDEPLAMDVLESYINQVNGLEIVGKCENAIQAFESLQKIPVDLLFLDIQMPQLSGIELMHTLKKPPKVIFTTAYRDYAIEGYELDAVDYLLKPISFGRFMKAINKLYRFKNNQHLSPPSLTDLPTQSNPLTFIYVRVEKKMVKLYLDDILYIESLKDYVAITTIHKKVVTKQKISYLEQKLPEDKFIRIHRSYIIAMDKIEAFSPTYIEIAHNDLPIGRSYKPTVMERLAVSERGL